VYYSATPLQGIRVELRQGDLSSPPFHTTHSAVDGHYEFSPVPPGLYSLTIYGEEGFVGWRSTPVLVGDADVTVDLYVPKVITLIDPPSGGGVDTPHPTLTWTSISEAEAGGRYMITINESATWALVERATGTTNSYDVTNALAVGVEYSWQIDAVDANGHEVGTGSGTFIVRPPPGTFRISGGLFYSATPLEGMTVSVHVGGPDQAALQTVQTGSGGHFAFTSLAPGLYWVRATGGGDYVEWMAQTVEISTSDVSWNMPLPKKIALLSPADGATVSTSNPLLTWTSNPEADAGGRYAIQINESATWVELEIGESAVASYAVQNPMTPGVEYTWQVDGYDGSGRHVGTTSFAFRVTATLP
jgi:hypothetical protein